ncbi:MAG TPA: GH32 C-terminal domain-containing protein, partial [Chryseolinea sp.]|nr:GH32 C-terminal domain-containing protein [Chryseolinea sp.]
FLRSLPVPELKKITSTPMVLEDMAGDNFDLSSKMEIHAGPARLQITSDTLREFSVTLSNAIGEKIVIGFDESENSYYIDRTAAGNVSFADGFGARHTAPRLSQAKQMELDIIIDDASVEIFGDKGLSVMTSIFFIDHPFKNIEINSKAFKIKSLSYSPLSSIWK